MLSAAIANEHRLHLKPSPTTHESISKLFRGFKLLHPQDRSPVLPVTEEIIHALFDHLYQGCHGRDGLRASLVTWRTVWRVVMEFHTLGRFSDIVTLKRDQVKFVQQPSLHLDIKFKGGKNDLYSEGSQRIVAADEHSPRYCPVKLTQDYFVFLGAGYNGYLVPASNPKFKPNPEKQVPYNGALEDLRNLFSTLGIEGRYGEHSGKRGGSTQAIENGMSFSQLKRLGGWRSDAMPAKYVDQSLSSRIKILQKKL